MTAGTRSHGAQRSYHERMPWTPATGHDLVRAPGSLGFVQDFINTAYVGSAQPIDPLVEPDDARSWLSEALRMRTATLGPIDSFTIEDRDVERMRELRATLRAVVADPGGPAASVGWRGPAVSTSFGIDGRLVLEPQGDGYRRFAGLVAIDVFVSQQAGTWSRLRICRNPRCAVAFYDRSRNASAVWHDARICGNAHNLRVSRARRQSQSTV